jgi:hypothetical protein
MQESHEDNPFPEIAFFLVAKVFLRLGNGAALQIETNPFPRLGRGQSLGLDGAGGVLHDVLVLYMVVEGRKTSPQ